MLLGEKAKGAAIELVKQQAARDILAAINKWRSSRISTAKRRWIFELIQNAVDAARARQKQGLMIIVECDGKKLTFKHNAGCFTFAEVDSIIYGTSSKPWGPESEYLGRFGTGFLVSHIVSKKVNIDGSLKDENGNVFRFELDINREGNTIDGISNSIEDCFHQLDNSEPNIKGHDIWTTYTYNLIDDLGSTAVSEGINQLRMNIPFLLAFNPILEIAIGTDRYSKQTVENIEGISKVKVGESCICYTISDIESKVHVGIAYDEKGIKELADTPPIFIGMPLTETADYLQLPFVINSLKLDTTPDRDSLENTQNNMELLKSAFGLHFKLLAKVLNIKEMQSLPNLYDLVQFTTVSDNQANQNPLWSHFNTDQKDAFQNIISNLPLVMTNLGLRTIMDTIFPNKEFDGKKMNDINYAKFYELIKNLGKTIPTEIGLSSWVRTAEMLQLIFPSEIRLYSIIDLKDEIENSVLAEDSLSTFEEISEKFEIANAKAFLKNFYEIVDLIYADKLLPIDFIKNVLPNQTGVLGPIDRRWLQSDIYFKLLLEDPQNPISDEFKEIVTKIGRSLRSELIHEDFSGFQIVKDYVREVTTHDRIINELISDTIYALPDKISTFDDEKVTGWIELFRWCIINKKLANGFQVITKDFGTAKLENVNKESLLVPFAVLKINPRFEEIYPESRILNSVYFEVEDTSRTQIVNALMDYRGFILSLPSFKKEFVFPYQKLASALSTVEEVSHVDHSLSCIAEYDSISYLPFWNEVIGRISEFKERAKLLFDFVMEYLASEDKSWQKSVRVNCSCKEKAHEIMPNNWLASLKTDAWIPIKVDEDGEEKTVKTSASKESIENLFEEGEFDKIIEAEPVLAMDLLPHFHFDKLDLKIKLHSLKLGKVEGEVREDASTLVELVGVVNLEDVKQIAQNPEAFQKAVAEMNKTVLDQQLKEENKIIGENIQMIMLRIVNDAGLKLKANSIYVGGDMEIWPTNYEGSDYGEITISPYIVEVKSTSGTRVHLSRAQSATAQAQKNNFIVLVVEDTGALRERLKTPLTQEEITEELIATLVEKAHILEEIHSKLGDLPNPDEVEADINGYWIKKKLWKEKVDLKNWLTKNFEPN